MPRVAAQPGCDGDPSVAACGRRGVPLGTLRLPRALSLRGEAASAACPAANPALPSGAPYQSLIKVYGSAPATAAGAQGEAGCKTGLGEIGRASCRKECGAGEGA